MRKHAIALLLLSLIASPLEAQWMMRFDPATRNISMVVTNGSTLVPKVGESWAPVREAAPPQDLSIVRVNPAGRIVQKSKPDIDRTTSTVALPAALDLLLTRKASLTAASDLADTTATAEYTNSVIKALAEVRRLRRTINP